MNKPLQHGDGVGTLPVAISFGAAGGPVGIAIGAGITAVQTALMLFLGRKKPKQKIATTKIVDQIEPYLIANLQAWNESDKNIAEQQAALDTFDQSWNAVVVQCRDPNLGTPGHWCIDDRKRGGKWDWFRRYRDPIANHVVVGKQGEGFGPVVADLGGFKIDMGLILGVVLIGGAIALKGNKK